MAILIVEDDLFYATQLAELLTDRGNEVLSARSAQEALKIPAESYQTAIVDVMLPNDPDASGISVEESRAGFLTGVAVARRFRKNRADLKIVLITGDVWGSESERWASSQGIPVVLKSEGQRAIRSTLQGLGLLDKKWSPRAFIVHGHDEVALLQLKNYLQNSLGWPEPLVLREQPNCGRTLIEKFEYFSMQIDCVFVLLTPDDAALSQAPGEPRRSRQNVIFELGFFFGQFKRNSGRVIVLYKGPNQLPSDIQGVVWISIDDGVETAGELIRREVVHLHAQDKA
ncbi:MAG TPA: TIR domain-containing protein [Candidatus Acidoferrales bacterium]|nr:TIR domain-containing protein [Candidatus Acidoferrales bacterium]